MHVMIVMKDGVWRGNGMGNINAFYLVVVEEEWRKEGKGRGGMGRGEGKGSGDMHDDDVSNRFEFESDQSNGRINVRIFHS